MYQTSWSYAILLLRYGAWRMLLFFLLGHFLPFHCPNLYKKSKFQKNEKKKKKAKMPGHIIILHKCTKHHDHMLYCSWDMVCDGCNCYFSFWAIFYPYNSPKNQNFKKMNKTPGDIIILHVYQKLWLDNVRFLRYGMQWTDRQTDGRMEKVTYRGGCPPKKWSLKLQKKNYTLIIKIKLTKHLVSNKVSD